MNLLGTILWGVISAKMLNFFRKVNLHFLFITGDNFYIQINCNTFGMWICIYKCRNTFDMTNSIYPNLNMVTFDLPGYDVCYMELSKYVCPVVHVYLVCCRELSEEVGHGWSLLVRSLTRVPSRGPNYVSGTRPTSSPSYSWPRELWPTHF